MVPFADLLAALDRIPDPRRRQGRRYGLAHLLLFSVLGYYGAASLGRIFVAGGMAGLFAVIGALAGLRWSAAGAAAVLVAILVAAVAGFPLLAMRIAKLPQPRVPQDPADLAAAALPARKDMFIAVVRTDEGARSTNASLGVNVSAATLVLSPETLRAEL